LLNPISSLSSRIDLVLFRGDFDVIDVDIVGEDPDDRHLETETATRSFFRPAFVEPLWLAVTLPRP